MYQIIVRHSSEGQPVSENIHWSFSLKLPFIFCHACWFSPKRNRKIHWNLICHSLCFDLSQTFLLFCLSVTAVLTLHFRLGVLSLNNNQALQTQKGKTGINLLVTGSFSRLLMSKKLVISWVRATHSRRWNQSSLFERTFCISFNRFEVLDDCSSALLCLEGLVYIRSSCLVFNDGKMLNGMHKCHIYCYLS